MSLLSLQFAGSNQRLIILIFFVLGSCLGNVLTKWIVRLTEEVSSPTPLSENVFSDHSHWSHQIPLFGFWFSRGQRSYRNQKIAGWGLLLEIITGVLFAGFFTAYTLGNCQLIDEVRPDEFWHYGRIAYHLILIGLLIAATGTDFCNYTIPDNITIPGTLIGIAGAFISGDLQTIHLWVDWNEAIPNFRGPYIPEWLTQHHHWHGLAWSLAGIAAGAGMTWLVRLVASWILGREALGFGDVTLMAMIGSFLGWQPMVLIFSLAPFCGILVAMIARVVFGQRYVPYGPFLSAGALAVLFGWRWIWTFNFYWSDRNTHSIRKLFSDPTGLAIIFGIALASLVILLGLMRLYQNLPVKQRSTPSPPDSLEK